jgi:hypothetical protein
LPGQDGGIALVVGQGEQEHLAGDVGVALFVGFFLGALQQADGVAPGLDLLGTLHLGQLIDLLLQGGGQRGHLDARLFQQGLGAIVLAQHGQQDVGRFDVGVLACDSQALGVGQRFLKLGGEFVESHVHS